VDILALANIIRPPKRVMKSILSLKKSQPKLLENNKLVNSMGVKTVRGALL